MDNYLLEKIRSRASNPNTIHDMTEGLSPAPSINPIATIDDLTKVVMSTGRSIPPALSNILMTIGNGGFGPGYGLYSTDEMIRVYKELCGDEAYQWPEEFLPICTWGCDYYSAIDTSDPEFAVYFYEGTECCEDDLEISMTDADGNPVTGAALDDVKKEIFGGDNNEEDDEEDNDDPYFLHRDTFDEFMTAWSEGVNLWDEVAGDEEEDDLDDENENTEPPSGGGGSARRM